MEIASLKEEMQRMKETEVVDLDELRSKMQASKGIVERGRQEIVSVILCRVLVLYCVVC